LGIGSVGVFVEWQPRYAGIAGIATLPIDPETKFWRGPGQRIGLPASTKFTRQKKYQDCNGIGFWCGPRNGITDVDVDSLDEKLLHEVLQRHGDTPILVQTASGKFKAWYRHNGERRSVRKLFRELWGRDVPIDLLGTGVSVAPPTINSKGAYTFIRGGLEDVQRLPVMRGLEHYQRPKEIILPDDVETPIEQPKQKITEGNRDNSLLRACMVQSKQVQTFDELLAFARSYNEETMQPALSDSVAVEKASSAWRYEALGLNTMGQRAIIIPQKLEKVSPDAMFLFCRVQRDHFWRDEFAMARAYGKSFGWGRQRLANATEELIAAGIITRLSRGGRYEGDAPIYAWIKTRADKWVGPPSDHYIFNTPIPTHLLLLLCSLVMFS
jgi:hypothetical protein